MAGREGYIIVPDYDLEHIQEELANHIQFTNEEEGCLLFNVEQGEINRKKFNVYEEFVDKNAFNSHQVPVKNSAWGKLSSNAERHYKITGL